MKNVKLFLFVFIIIVITISLGFGHGTPDSEFTADSNPIMTEGNPTKCPIFRHSSDPSARAYCHENDDPEAELWMFTTCDIDLATPNPTLVETYPMNTIYCYSTTDMKNWKNWGDVLTKDKFTWADQEVDHLWAPETLSANIGDVLTYIIYAPLLAEGEFTVSRDTTRFPNGVPVSRIGVARSTEGPHSGYAAESAYIQGIGTNGNGTLINSGYASDPAIYYEKVEGQTYDDIYLTYTNGDWWTLTMGQICLAKMSGSSTVELDYGPVEITNDFANGHIYDSSLYKEGSALFKINDNYYLIFSEKPTNGNQQIVYAMNTEAGFNDGSPDTGWVYKGAIMGSGNHWTNHAYISKFYDDNGEMRYYFLYHTGNRDDYGNHRNVCIKKLDFNDNGEIIPITHTVTMPKKINLKLTYILDEGYNESNIVKPRIYFENTGCGALKDFKARYYFTVENGKTPVIEDWWTPNCTIALEHISGNQWAVVLDFTGTTLGSGDRIPKIGGIIFGIHYSDWSYFDKTNDFSQPPSSAYTVTYNIAVFDKNGKLVLGNVPEEEQIISNKMKNQYSGKMLTVTNDSDYATVVCQDLNSSWTSQDWIMESSGGNIRLKNVWSGRYLTVTSDADGASVVCQPFNTGWTSQEWVIENVPNGSRRLKNVWSGKYLTVTSTSEGASILAQNLNTGWTSQQWWIE